MYIMSEIFCKCVNLTLEVSCMKSCNFLKTFFRKHANLHYEKKNDNYYRKIIVHCVLTGYFIKN